MSMQISGVNSTVASQNSATVSWQQRQQNFSDLFSALQSGNLSAAQTAYAQLTGSTNSSNGAASSTTASSTVNSSSPLAQIGQALQNGDLAAAQKAAQAFQSGHGHHHHHGGGGQNTAASAASSLSSTQATSSSAGSVINTTA